MAVVERRRDDDGDTSTRIRRLAAGTGLPMTINSIRERLRNACGVEHAEAFFARAGPLVEGETEQAALPVYAVALGMDFDALGVSIVSAGGKAGLDALHQLYDGLGLPVFLLFDNDVGGDAKGIPLNKVLTRLVGVAENERPAHSRCPPRYLPARLRGNGPRRGGESSGWPL